MKIDYAKTFIKLFLKKNLISPWKVLFETFFLLYFTIFNMRHFSCFPAGPSATLSVKWKRLTCLAFKWFSSACNNYTQFTQKIYKNKLNTWYHLFLYIKFRSAVLQRWKNPHHLVVNFSFIIIFPKKLVLDPAWRGVLITHSHTNNRMLFVATKNSFFHVRTHCRYVKESALALIFPQHFPYYDTDILSVCATTKWEKLNQYRRVHCICALH